MGTSPIHSSGQNKRAFAAKDNRVAASKNEINENELSAGMSSLERVPQSLNGGSRLQTRTKLAMSPKFNQKNQLQNLGNTGDVSNYDVL